MSNISVRHLNDEGEFNELNNIYHSCFGAHSVPTDRQKEWWESSKDNILGLFSEDCIIGGVSFWSINMITFERLSTGHLRERDIRIEDFDNSLKKFYYISDLAINEKYRQKRFSNLLLLNLFEQIESDSIKDMGIKILAFAFSESGARILTKLGFKKIKDATMTLDHQDLFLLELSSPKGIVNIKNRLL